MSSEAPQRIEVVPFPIGTWSPELRQELIELEQISQKVSNKAEKMIFRKDGGPKITYSILTGDFLTRPELYKNSWVYVARHPETARIIAVVVASIKECLVKGKPVNVAFTYLGRISPDSRSGNQNFHDSPSLPSLLSPFSPFSLSDLSRISDLESLSVCNL